METHHSLCAIIALSYQTSHFRSKALGELVAERVAAIGRRDPARVVVLAEENVSLKLSALGAGCDHVVRPHGIFSSDREVLAEMLTLLRLDGFMNEFRFFLVSSSSRAHDQLDTLCSFGVDRGAVCVITADL